MHLAPTYLPLPHFQRYLHTTFWPFSTQTLDVVMDVVATVFRPFARIIRQTPSLMQYFAGTQKLTGNESFALTA
jgi:hypothetical protein